MFAIRPLAEERLAVSTQSIYIAEKYIYGLQFCR